MLLSKVHLSVALSLTVIGSGVYVSDDVREPGETERLTGVLDNIPESYFPSFRFSIIGSGPSQFDAPFLAIEGLCEIGTADAFQVIEEFLTRPVRHRFSRDLKQYALLKVASLGTAPAMDVIRSFDRWAETRRESPALFRIGLKDHGSAHFAPYELKALSTALDRRGVKWAVFEWGVYPGTKERDWELWLTRSQEGGGWGRPVFLNIPFHRYADDKRCRLQVEGERFLLDCQGAAHRFTLAEKQRDTDGDSLADLVERRLGTDLRHPDSDGDGVPDGKDGNPLTPPLDRTDDTTQIRQAVFSFMYATSDSEDVLVVEQGRPFAKQEYRGYRGIVIPAPRLGQNCATLTRFAVTLDAADAATVEINESGLGSGAGWQIGLKKYHGKWVVVDYRLVDES
jgi:hypothetical protein